MRNIDFDKFQKGWKSYYNPLLAIFSNREFNGGKALEDLLRLEC